MKRAALVILLIAAAAGGISFKLWACDGAERPVLCFPHAVAP